MGNRNSEDAQQKEISVEIDHSLADSHKKTRKILKLLLLGTAEGGKSTVLKQMRILHCNGFNEEEYMSQKVVIHANIINGMQSIISAMHSFEIRFQDPARGADSFKVEKEAIAIAKPGAIPNISLDGDLVKSLKNLWLDLGVQQCFERGNEYHLGDSFKYFMEEIDRIAANGYRPNQQDFLRSRAPTTGIVEIRFQLKGHTFRVFDVGGQRSQRRKWIHCFEGVNAIIFVVGVSEFDQKLWEDERKNRLRESQKLFGTIVNNKFFKDTDFILFFNKKDLFKEKLKRSSLKIAYPHYKGAHTYEESFKFIAYSFLGMNKIEARKLYVHRTCSTDTNQVQLVLENCLDTIVSNNMRIIAMN